MFKKTKEIKRAERAILQVERARINSGDLQDLLSYNDLSHISEKLRYARYKSLISEVGQLSPEDIVHCVSTIAYLSKSPDVR